MEDGEFALEHGEEVLGFLSLDNPDLNWTPTETVIQFHSLQSSCSLLILRRVRTLEGERKKRI